MEARKEEFRQYLEESGVLSALTKALIKLYEMKYDRPGNAVAFIQNNLSDKLPSLTEYQNLLKELDEKSAIIATYENAGVTVGSGQQMKMNENENATKVNSGASKTSLGGVKNLLEQLHNDTACNSLLKKHLTIELFEKLKDRTTSSGKSLIDCINAGLKHPSSSVGIYAADADAYEVFAEIFNPIIEAYHSYPADQDHPVGDGWEGDDSQLVDLDPDRQYITSTRIRCARSLEDFPLNTSMSESHYLDLMKKVTDVLATLTDDLKGTFYPLDGMDPALQEKMIQDHQLFKSDDEHLRDAGALKFWPKGRGIFKNDGDTFLVWVCEEDHLRFISMDEGGDIQKTYNRLKDAVTKCSILTFKTSKHLGWITFCPTNLGSTIRASVMIRLPNLATQGNLKELADANNLQIRGTHGKFECSGGK